MGEKGMGTVGEILCDHFACNLIQDSGKQINVHASGNICNPLHAIRGQLTIVCPIWSHCSAQSANRVSLSLSLWLTGHVIGASAHFKFILNGFFQKLIILYDSAVVLHLCVCVCACMCLGACVCACVRGIYHNFII